MSAQASLYRGPKVSGVEKGEEKGGESLVFIWLGHIAKGAF